MKAKIMTALLAVAAGLGITAAMPSTTAGADTAGSVIVYDGNIDGVVRVFQGQLPPKTMTYRQTWDGGRYTISVTLQSYREAGDGQYIGIYAGELHRLGERPAE